MHSPSSVRPLDNLYMGLIKPRMCSAHHCLSRGAFLRGQRKILRLAYSAFFYLCLYSWFWDLWVPYPYQSVSIFKILSGPVWSRYGAVVRYGMGPWSWSRHNTPCTCTDRHVMPKGQQCCCATCSQSSMQLCSTHDSHHHRYQQFLVSQSQASFSNRRAHNMSLSVMLCLLSPAQDVCAASDRPSAARRASPEMQIF